MKPTTVKTRKLSNFIYVFFKKCKKANYLPD